MLRTLKIAKFLAAVAAVCFIAYLAVSGLEPDEETEATLAKPSAVSTFRKLSAVLNRAKDKESEFVKQAKKFALRINPPPPPVVTPQPGNGSPTKVTTVAKAIIPTKKLRVKKFSLVGTLRYEDKPEKSLAQLNIVAEGKKWVHQGDTVGHLTIYEVKDGSIVLYQGGTLNTEIFVPPAKKTKSLLKSTEDTETIAKTEKIVKEDVEFVFEAITNAPANKANTMSARTPPAPRHARTPKWVPPKRVPTKPVVTKPVVPKPEPIPPKPPTPAEQKKALDESIAEIQKIINENISSSKDGKGRADQMMLEGLIKMLEEDKKRIDSMPPPAKKPPGKKSEPAKKPANTQK
jgi:hypothetical protein